MLAISKPHNCSSCGQLRAPFGHAENVNASVVKNKTSECCVKLFSEAYGKASERGDATHGGKPKYLSKACRTFKMPAPHPTTMLLHAV